MPDTPTPSAVAAPAADAPPNNAASTTPGTAPSSGTAPDPAPPAEQQPGTDAPATDEHDPTDDSNEDNDAAEDDGAADDVARWKRRAREWERRAKRNNELAERYPSLEARLNELQEQYEDALGARTRAEAELWRERAARAHGIPDDLFEFLTGASETEVMERAARIAERVTGPRRPLPDPTQGRGSAAPASPADAFAAFLRDSLNK
jgi:hypothetical protein